jgi:hypothetical protein
LAAQAGADDHRTNHHVPFHRATSPHEEGTDCARASRCAAPTCTTGPIFGRKPGGGTARAACPGGTLAARACATCRCAGLAGLRRGCRPNAEGSYGPLRRRRSSQSVTRLS